MSPLACLACLKVFGGYFRVPYVSSHVVQIIIICLCTMCMMCRVCCVLHRYCEQNRPIRFQSIGSNIGTHIVVTRQPSARTQNATCAIHKCVAICLYHSQKERRRSQKTRARVSHLCANPHYMPSSSDTHTRTHKTHALLIFSPRKKSGAVGGAAASTVLMLACVCVCVSCVLICVFTRSTHFSPPFRGHRRRRQTTTCSAEVCGR